MTQPSVSNNSLTGPDTAARSVALDAVCGLLIVHMILMHVYQQAGLTEAPEYEWSRLLAFFMPWFFYKAGMFYKKRPLKQVVKTSAERLLIPFVVFTVLGECVLLISNALKSDASIPELFTAQVVNSVKGILLGGSSYGNLVLWFLPSLFAVRVLWAFCMEHRAAWAIVIICALAPICYFLSFRHPFYVANISSGLAYYALGYLLRKIQVPNILWAIVLIGLWILSILFFPNYIDMRSNVPMQGFYLLSYPQNLLGIIAINSLFSSNRLNFPILVSIGRDSMGYYCIHWIILLGVGMFFTDYATQAYTYVMVALLALVMLNPLFIRAINKSQWHKLIH